MTVVKLEAVDSKFENFVVSLIWSHMVAKQQTVKEYWKALAWSLESLWQGNWQNRYIILTGLSLLTFFESLRNSFCQCEGFESLRGTF